MLKSGPRTRLKTFLKCFVLNTLSSKAKQLKSVSGHVLELDFNITKSVPKPNDKKNHSNWPWVKKMSYRNIFFFHLVKVSYQFCLIMIVSASLRTQNLSQWGSQIKLIDRFLLDLGQCTIKIIYRPFLFLCSILTRKNPMTIEKKYQKCLGPRHPLGISALGP